MPLSTSLLQLVYLKPDYEQIGGEFSWHVVLVMGFSTIAANALSMGAGEYLSSKAHREFIQAEKRRELWEFKHFKDVETKEVRSTSL
jgi:vacuolar iron transporter family protein